LEVVAARGAGKCTVELVAARAEVSRASFYEHFAGLQEATIATLEESLAQIRGCALTALQEHERHAARTAASWWERRREALAAVLRLFDEQPDLARICIVEAFAAGAVVRAHMEGAIACTCTALVEQLEAEGSLVSPLAVEGLLGAVMSVVRARLLAPAHERRPLIELLGPLVGLVVGPFMDDELARREVERAERRAREIVSRGRRVPEQRTLGANIPMALLDVRAHRLRRCMLYVAARPGASNQQVGEAVGVAHRGQLAKLLGRLHELGLLDKRAGAPGRPNAWSATHAGHGAAAALCAYAPDCGTAVASTCA
jgi:AcrR family transcriptional regulator